MSKLNSLMDRFKPPKKEKISSLIDRNQTHTLPTPFQVRPINEEGKIALQLLLENYKTEKADISADLKELSTITSEVKAINNQAVILHGMRIKQAQTLFKKYREGAFSLWLLKTYGNRQTPYNFLLYYELYSSLPKNLQEIIDEMPRQTIYTLSSRSISQKEKESFIESYQGETKAELLEKLRNRFPLSKRDKRNTNQAKRAAHFLKQALKAVENPHFSPTTKERALLQELSKTLHSYF